MKTKLLIVAFLLVIAENVSAQWIQRANFTGIPRAKSTSFIIGDKIYMMGGVDNNSVTYADFWEYDIPSNTWTQKTAFPGPERYGAAAFVINNKGYIATGGNDNGYLDDLWQFDPATNNWVQKTGLPVGSAQHENQRAEAFAFAIGNKGYLGGGNGWSFGANQTLNTAFYDLWEYNPATDVWTPKASEPDFIGRNMSIAASINGKGYIGLGCNVEQNASHPGFWEYDPTNDTWTAKTDFPTTFTTDASSFVLGTELFVVGGVRLTPSVSLSNQVYKFDPVMNTWTQLSDFSGSAIAGEFAVSTGTKAFVGTGYTGSLVTRRDLWEMSLTTGISENQFGKEVVTVYPNPSNDFISVRVEKNISSLEIIDINGKIVSKQSGYYSPISIQQFPVGVYNLKLVFKDGSTNNCRFVKEN